MKSTPLIDIIIPVYNRASIVIKTLRSIELQTVKPARVILVDNNSTDNTKQVLEQWAEEMNEKGQPVYVLSEEIPGAAAARNRGLDASTAEYVMFFDSDDIMHPDHVESFAKCIENHPDTDIAGKSFRIKLLNGKTKLGRFYAVMPLFFNVFTGQMATLRIVARRSLFERAGRWNPEIRGWDDIELGQRMLLLNPKIEVVPGASTADVEVLDDSISDARFSDRPEKWERALEEMRLTASEANRRNLVNWIDCRRIMLAATYSVEGKEVEAARLRKQVLEENKNSARLKLVYWYHRRFRRFTWVLCRVIF